MTASSTDQVELDTLRRQADHALREALGPSESFALVNFPDIGNVGDSALWLGTMASLHRLGLRPAFHVGIGELTNRVLNNLIGVDVVLINGGGNFGDLWEGQQETREQVLEACRGQRIVQLPQSIWFQNEDNLSRVEDLVRRAGNVTLMWRDRRSFEFATRELPGNHVLAPDMAFGLEPTRRVPTLDILCLVRSDKESRFPDYEWMTDGVKVTDWRLDPAPDHPHLEWTRQRAREMRSEGVPGPLVEPLLMRVAGWRTERGFDILGAGRVVITDRLHGHIMSLLLGRPHILIDNVYGKISELRETWTRSIGKVELADEPADAIETARSLLQQVL